VRYDVRLSAEELAELTALVGRPLHSVAGDGFAVELSVGDAVLAAVPEEIPTPDDRHPHAEATRPKFLRVDSPRDRSSWVTVGKDLGTVKAVRILSTFLSFSPTSLGRPVEVIPGVTIPASVEYEECHTASVDLAVNSGGGSDSAVVALDFGVEIEVNGSRVSLFVLGYSVRAQLDGIKELWGEENEQYVAVHLRPPA
jgi:hypothetical protein